MIRPRIGTKRGLSTIVTSGILLAAVAILGAGVVGWSNSNLAIHQDKLQSTFSQNINKISEVLTFENVWFGGTYPNQFVNITLNNVGTVGLNITKIKFADPTDGSTLATFSITDGGVSTKTTYSEQFDYAWTDNVAIDIFVTTERTTQFQTQVMP